MWRIISNLCSRSKMPDYLNNILEVHNVIWGLQQEVLGVALDLVTDEQKAYLV